MWRAWPDLFDEDNTVAMDYACRIGNVSQTLCQCVKTVVGVDISQASVDHFNTQAENQGLEPNELTGEPSELGGLKFDIVVCCASHHHFPSIPETTRVLASFLKPGGSLLVADIKAEEDRRVILPPKSIIISYPTRGG